jgi:hypothetical protein
MLAGIPERNLLKLCHCALNVKRGTTRARISAREQRTLPVLEEVEVEGLAETQAEDLEVRVSWY